MWSTYVIYCLNMSLLVIQTCADQQNTQICTIINSFICDILLTFSHNKPQVYIKKKMLSSLLSKRTEYILFNNLASWPITLKYLLTWYVSLFCTLVPCAPDIRDGPASMTGFYFVLVEIPVVSFLWDSYCILSAISHFLTWADLGRF